MRSIPAVLFLIAGISVASAQSSSSTDNARGADAAAAATAAAQSRNLAALTRAAAIASGRPLSPSQSTDFKVNGGGVVRAGPALTPEQEQADADGRAAWLARCKPTVVEDREGLRRTKYAEPDCDISGFNTAGAK
jgi:hypothetical protein